MLKFFTLKYPTFAPTCFGPSGPVMCVLSAGQLPGTQYTHHSLKHMLSQYCTTYNDVFPLINSTKV